MDKIVNEKEISELLKWSEIHHDLINRNPFREFMLMINELIKEKSDKKEAVEDLFWLCQKYENSDFFYDAITSDLQTLHGVCHGIMADGEVTHEEILALNGWLAEHTHLIKHYPYDEICTIISLILEDGKVTEFERNRIEAFFTEFINISNDEIRNKIENDIKNIDISFICSKNVRPEFDGTTFCFTGISSMGTRDEIAQQIEYLGAHFSNSVSSKTNYLIIGETDNPCWAYACYGRKVEKAMSLRKEGKQIVIMKESDFWKTIHEIRK